MQVFDLPEPDFRPLSLGFSPDGRLLATWRQGRVFVLDALNGSLLRATGAEDHRLVTVAGIGFTADSRVLIASEPASRFPIHRYDVASGELVGQTSGHALEVGPGGRFVYLALDRNNRNTVFRWDPLTGEEAPVSVATGRLYDLAVSADEQWVAAGEYRVLRVWRVDGPVPPTRAARQFRLGTFSNINGLALSHDGAFLAHTRIHVQVGDVRTGEMWVVSERALGRGREVAFHPAAPVLAYSNGTGAVTFYDPGARRAMNRYAWKIGPVAALAFSADGLRCAAAGEGKVIVWDVDV